jgi:flagellin-like protein
MKNSERRRKKAISEVMGAIILLGVTLSVGFATWAWATSGAAAGERSLGNSITESFRIVDANFSSSSQGRVTVWIYDSASAPLYVNAIIISNSTWTYDNSTLSSAVGPACSNCFKVNGNQLEGILLNLKTSFTAGSMYTIRAVGEYGNEYSYQVVR